MNILIDTSIVIAVITNERHKGSLIGMTKGAHLFAPVSLHWEIGNALSATMKRKRLTFQQAKEAIGIYEKIPITFIDISLKDSLEITRQTGMYAYDAYFIVAARQRNLPFLSLDNVLLERANTLGIKIVKVG